jgi:protein-tyrosine-phosphatase
MTTAHIQQLEFQYNNLPSKIFTFRHWLNDNEIDIPDPFGGDIEEYKNCLDSIEESISGIAQYLESHCQN